MSNLGNFGIPNPQLPLGIAPGKDGAQLPVRANEAWYRFWTRLSQLSAERPIASVAVGPSPFSYTATTIGMLTVSGGTVSLRQLTRGDVTIDYPTLAIPMAAGDIATLTYTVAPEVHFVPGARA